MCCIVGETVPSDKCPHAEDSTNKNSTDKYNTLIVVVSSLGAFLLVSALVVVALLWQQRRHIKRLAALTTEKLERDTDSIHGDNEGIQETLCLQEQAVSISEVENQCVHTDQTSFKSSVDIQPSPPIAIAELILPLPPPPPST